METAKSDAKECPLLRSGDTEGTSHNVCPFFKNNPSQICELTQETCERVDDAYDFVNFQSCYNFQSHVLFEVPTCPDCGAKLIHTEGKPLTNYSCSNPRCPVIFVVFANGEMCIHRDPTFRLELSPIYRKQ